MAKRYAAVPTNTVSVYDTREAAEDMAYAMTKQSLHDKSPRTFYVVEILDQTMVTTPEVKWKALNN